MYSIVRYLVCFYVIIFSFNAFQAQAAEKTIWVKIQYGGLIDTAIIIHSGQKLKHAIKDPELTGEVQPYVDQYSSLLPYALQLVQGQDQAPYHNIVDHYSIGSEQPAWVALCRSGRYYIMTDNHNKVRIFAPGVNAEVAYEEHYPVLRHCLGTLCPPDNSNLQVEVYAYDHDYQKSEIRLYCVPYTFASSVFSKSENKTDINISGLVKFFDTGYELVGAKIDRDLGLVLYGQAGSEQTINGYPLTIADFAVAYRAAFHAGDNYPYVSLDDHVFATRAAVNYGGFLENTRIGQVVLDADKRFKTVISGHDYKTFDDMHISIRKHVPSYLSVTERYFLNMESFKKSNNWVKTRFWFYPDSIEVQTDNELRYAVITKPRFVADAERSRDDFKSLEDFEKKKQKMLPPSIRLAIDDLNNHYDQYTTIFREFRELDPVARLIGLCGWLRKADPGWLDLDALLAVRVPGHITPIDNLQYISCSYMIFMENQTLNVNYIQKYLHTFYLTPHLDETVAQFFGVDTNIAMFLCVQNGQDIKKHKKYKKEAIRLLEEDGNKLLRNFLKEDRDVQAFARYNALVIEKKEPPAIGYYQMQYDSLVGVLEEIEEQIEQSTGNQAIYKHHVDEYNEVVNRINDLNRKMEKLGIGYPTGVQISGGVNVDPAYITMKRGKPQSEIKAALAHNKMSHSGSGNGLDSLIRVTSKDIPHFKWRTQAERTVKDINYKRISGADKQNAWVAANDKTGTWHSQIQVNKEYSYESSYNPVENSIEVIEYFRGDAQESIVGTRTTDQLIVFTPAVEKSDKSLKSPPAWWYE